MLYLQVTLLCVCCVQWIYVGVEGTPTHWAPTMTPAFEDATTVARTSETGDPESTSDFPGGESTTPNFDLSPSGPAAATDGPATETSQEEKAARPDEAQPQLSTDGHIENPDPRNYYSASAEEKGPKITLFSASGVLSDEPQFSTRTGAPHSSTDPGPTANTAQGYSSTTPYPPFSSQYFEDSKGSTTDNPPKRDEDDASPSTEQPSENDISEATFDTKPYHPNSQISSNYIEDSQPSESKTTLLGELTSALRAAFQNPDEASNANLQISTYLADTNAAAPLTNYTAEHNATLAKLADSISAYLAHEDDQKESETAAAPEDGTPVFEPTAPVDGRYVTPSMKPIIVTDLVYQPYYSPQPVYNPAFYYETEKVESQTTPSEFEQSQNATPAVSVESVESYSNGESGQLGVQPQQTEVPTSGTTQHTTTVREASTVATARSEEGYAVTPEQQSYDYTPSASEQVEFENLKNYQIFGQKIVKEEKKEVEVEKQELEAKPVYTTVVEIQKSIPLEIKEVGQNYDVFIEPNAKTPSNVVQEVIGNNVEQPQQATASDYQQPQQAPPTEYQQPSTVEYQQPPQPEYQQPQQTSGEYQPQQPPQEYPQQQIAIEYPQPQQPEYQSPQQSPANEYLSMEQYSAQRYHEAAQQAGQQNIFLIQTLPALIPAEVIGNSLHPLREQQEQMASENQPYASHYVDQMTVVPVNPEPAFAQPQPQQNVVVNLEQPAQTHFPTKHHSLHYNLINEPHYGRPAVPTYSPVLYHRLYGDKTNSHKGYGPVKVPFPVPHAMPVPLTKILPPAPLPIPLHYGPVPQHQPPSYTAGSYAAPNHSPYANTIRESSPENRLPYGHSYPYGKSKISIEKLRQQFMRYDPHSRNPPFRPSMQLYDSVYPPSQMFQEEMYITKRGSNGRGTRGTYAKKLCVEYGGFKPPLIPSVEIKDDPAASFAKKSDEKN